eukprot:SAG31_NODE_9139_length_1328_cov_1.128560_2_plen_32_part_01
MLQPARLCAFVADTMEKSAYERLKLKLWKFME